MNRRLALISVLAALVMVAAAAGAALAQDVSVNYVPGKDFSGYKTYKWVEVQGAEKPDQIVDSQIKQAIDKALASKGFAKATGDKADLFIAYQIAVNQERQWNTYGMGGYGWRMGGGMATTTSSTIQIGTIALDMYDSAAKELVWKGQASKTIDPGAKPEKRQQNIEKAMTKLLKDFPPKPKK